MHYGRVINLRNAQFAEASITQIECDLDLEAVCIRTGRIDRYGARRLGRRAVRRLDLDAAHFVTRTSAGGRQLRDQRVPTREVLLQDAGDSPTLLFGELAPGLVSHCHLPLF